MPDWLELELAHRLTPVEAPEGLWERVESGRPARGVHRAPPRAVWTVWPVAAMAALALAAGALWLADVREPVLDIRQLAASEWWQSAPLELHTNDPGEIRRWLRQHTGLDVPLPAATAVRLEGARVVRRGAQRVAAVVFHVKQDTVTLLVARADAGSPLPPHGGRMAAWQARDQVYALASSHPERVEAACLLCHASL
ncbi:MAG: hypothetical protein ACLQU1_17425 [Bryobacteraceae bacterium]